MRQSGDQDPESSLKDNFKLSSYEARAYLSLLRLGEQNPKQISASAEVPMPRIYDTLESLMAKGFAIKSEQGYSPIPPKQALRGRSSQFESEFELEQRQRKHVEEALVAQLEPAPKIAKESGEIAILRGLNSIANKFSELLEDSNDIILIAKRAIEAKEVFIPLLVEYAASKKGAKKIRIIAPSDAKITRNEAEEARKAHAEIRRSDHVMFDMMITEKNDVIIGVPDPLSEEINHAVAIWVKNASFARSTRDSVEEIWKDAKRA